MKFSLQMTIHNFGRSLLHAFYEIRITGNLPNPSVPQILLGNHSGLLDGFFLFCATNRPISVMTKTEVFNSFSRRFLLLGGAIETDWKDADHKAIDEARKTLANGKDVGLFPEGTRCKGDFAWIKDGVIVLNAESRVDFIPVFIFGTRFTGKSKNWVPKYKSLIEIVIGEKINARDIYGESFDKHNRKSISIAGERLRQQLQSQLQECLQNVANPLPTDEVD